ncbi:MAG: hypothetical protein PHV02_19555, partial [Rhodocyclaceae bacterium]|nr:hypothetical protein [Rhodocyclaceae bacterium]
KARKIAPSITTHLNRFNVLLHAIDHNRDLKLADQVAGYRALLAEFPEQKKLLEELIELRNKEMKDGAIKSI